MKSILAIDQGTTSTRALIIDANGQVAARAQVDLAGGKSHCLTSTGTVVSLELDHVRARLFSFK